MARTATTLDVPTARAFVPLLAKARYKGAHGGRGSAKSRFMSGNCVRELVVDPTLRFVCIREVQKSLEQSVKRLLEDRIKEFDVGDRIQVSKTQLTTEQGGLVIFQGMQDHTADSIKSLEGFDRAWVEEAQSLSQRSLDLLRPTLRKEDSEMWFSWNPRLPTDPIDRFLRGPNKPPGAVVIEVNYRDNPWFPNVLRDEMEWDRKIDPEKFRHVWLGEYERNSEARVFKNWSVDEFDAPANAVFLFGSDWGFSVDPTVAIRAWVDNPPGRRKRLNIDYEAYKIGCEIDYTPDLFDKMVCGCPPLTKDAPIEHNPERALELARKSCPRPELHGQMRKWTSIADSARPETISFLQRHGYRRMEPAVKGPNSVKDGVIFLQGYDIRIHKRCTHVIDEFTHFSYKVDPKQVNDDGTPVVTNILDDKKNHVIDSVRYAVEKLRRGSSRIVFGS